MSYKIAPSILAADYANFASELARVDASGAEYVHIDIMDGQFVPNISWGADVVASMRKHSKLVFDCHLMVVDPERYVDAYAQAGADIMTIHVEATKHIHGALQKIKAAGMKAGAVINPGTPVEALIPVLDLVDQVLIMTVNPGFGGQAFIPGLCDVEPDFHLSNDVYHMWTFAENDGDLELPEELASHVRMVPWHEHSSDVVADGISKASGVGHVLEHENLKPENAMMFGDGPNDMEIFDYVGLKIAMGNATPELKEKADYVTGTVEEDGIFHALEELGLVEKELHFPQLDLDSVEGPVATIKTNHGDLVIKLFPDHAPLTVTNFVNLAKSGYYDGVIFHRIIKNFMIQGGDPTGTGMGGESSFGGSFQDEFSKELYNLRGALSMANAGPDTNGSQFFIVQTPEIPYSKKELERGGWPAPIAEAYAENGGTPHLDHRHTVFGQLVDEASYKVLDEIASVEVGPQDKPLEDVVIETVEVAD